MSFERLLSSHVMKERKLRAQFILLLLVSLLVCYALVFVNSMISGIRERFTELGGGEITVEGTYPEGDQVVVASALVYGKESVLPIALKGVGQEYLHGKRGNALRSLQLGTEWDAHSILLSNTLSDELDVGMGEKVLLVLSTQNSLRPLLCKVAGLYDSGYAELDSQLVFMPYDTLLPYGFPVQTELLGIGSIPEKLHELRVQGYQANAWYESESDLAQNLATSQKVVFLIFCVIILLAAYFASEFASSLFYDKKKEIALLTLIGSSHGAIMRSYMRAIVMLEGLSLFCGFLLGLVLSYLSRPLLCMVSDVGFPALSYYLLTFTIRIPWLQLFLVAILLFLSSLVSACIGMHGMRRINPLSVIG